MSLNDPDQQNPELIEFEDALNNPNYPPWPPEIVSKWRIGSQLRHSMESESAYIGHPQGAVEFIRLLQTFKAEDMEKVYPRDMDIILEIMCTFDRADLMKLLLQHQYLSDLLRTNKNKTLITHQGLLEDHDDEVHDNNEYNTNKKYISTTKAYNPLQSTLKKSIRSGKINVLNYLISQDIIPIKLFCNEQIQSKQFETDLKSLLYNILRAIEIGSKALTTTTRSNCFLCAQQFWPYLVTKVNDLKQSMFTNTVKNETLSDDEVLKKLISSDHDEYKLDKSYALMQMYQAMNEDYLIIKYMSLFMPTMFSKKEIPQQQLVAIFDVLKFQRERFITFVNRKDIVNTWQMLCQQLVINCMDSTYGNYSSACIELEMIDYLIAGGVSIDDEDKASMDNNIQKAIQSGENNWKLRDAPLETIKTVMPQVLPIEINKLIIFMCCL